MISMEAWVTIRYLRAQGRSIKGIARELGLSKTDFNHTGYPLRTEMFTKLTA